MPRSKNLTVIYLPVILLDSLQIGLDLRQRESSLSCLMESNQSRHLRVMVHKRIKSHQGLGPPQLDLVDTRPWQGGFMSYIYIDTIHLC